MVFHKKNDPISWFFQNLGAPLFSHAEVLTLSAGRLKPATLQNWTNRKYLEPEMINRKRRYNALQVAQLLMSQPLISQFNMEPQLAIIVGLGATIVFQQKLKSKEFSLSQAPRLLCIFRDVDHHPNVVLTPTAKLFETDEAFIVLPFGRLLNDLAKRQMELVDSRSLKAAA